MRKLQKLPWLGFGLEFLQDTLPCINFVIFNFFSRYLTYKLLHYLILFKVNTTNSLKDNNHNVLNLIIA